MDASAIQEIAKLATCDAHKSDKFIVIQEGQEVQSTERFQASPDRFRGTFTTNIVEEFTTYLNTNASSNTGVFIDPGYGLASAVIDLGTQANPQWGSHKANLVLEATPEYATLITTNGLALKQANFIDLVEDFSECFTFHFAGNFLDTKETVQRLRRLSVNSAASAQVTLGDAGESRSLADSVEVKVNGAEQPPEGFTFTCSPYEGFGPFTAECRLRFVVEGDKATIKYRIIGKAKLEKAIADALLSKLYDQITVAGIQRYLGKMQY
jgi:uncharacterized protein YfdQ (DUF2303 family)